MYVLNFFFHPLKLASCSPVHKTVCLRFFALNTFIVFLITSSDSSSSDPPKWNLLWAIPDSADDGVHECEECFSQLLHGHALYFFHARKSQEIDAGDERVCDDDKPMLPLLESKHAQVHTGQDVAVKTACTCVEAENQVACASIKVRNLVFSCMQLSRERRCSAHA